MVDTAPAGTTPDPAQNDQRAVTRAQAIEGLRQARGDVAPATAGDPPPPAPPGDAPPAPSDPPAEESPETSPPPGESPPTPPAQEPAPPAGEPPGMAAVRKQEQHLRKQLAQERAAMQADHEAKIAAWQVKVDKAAAIERSIANARQDPLAAMAALGFSEADFDGLGRLLYAHSPEGQKDPRHKAAAHQTLAQREQSERLEKLQAKLEAIEAQQAQQLQHQAVQQEIDKFLRTVTKAVGDSTPFVRSALTKNPERTQRRLLEIADRLYVESGPSNDLRDVPTAADVLTAYEAERIAELEEHGIDAKAWHTPPAPAAAPKPTAPPSRPSTTIAPSGASAPSVPKTEAPPAREEVLAGLAKLRSLA